MSNSLSRRRATARAGRAKVEREQAAWRAEETARQDAQRQAVRERRAAARQAEADRPKLTRDDVAGATHVRDRFGWHEVVRVSAKSVTVATSYSWTERIPLDRVLEVRHG